MGFVLTLSFLHFSEILILYLYNFSSTCKCPLLYPFYFILYPLSLLYSFMIKFLFSFPQWLRVLFSLLYLSIVAFLSLLPSDEVPQIELFAGFDKVVHGSMYFGLTVLACWTFHAEEKRIRIFYIVLFSATFGLMMEFSQLEMHAGRAFEWTDELSNAVGAMLGAGVYVWIAGIYRKKG
ncbi:MAG: VanZ family protein [Bacteroidia bacterium]|nr:VanZ family protein [Bacteroidia bacterium]